MNQLPLDASPRQILNATDDQLRDLIARKEILAIRDRAIAEQKASEPDLSTAVAVANDGLLTARAAVSAKQQGVRLEDRLPPAVTPEQEENVKQYRRAR